MENSMEVPQKAKNRTTIWSRNSAAGKILEENENTNSKRYMHTNVHSSIIYNCQDTEAALASINRWMDKDMVYIHDGKLLSHKKEWNFAIYNTMDGLGGYYAKWNKSDRERQISLICGI